MGERWMWIIGLSDLIMHGLQLALAKLMHLLLETFHLICVSRVELLLELAALMRVTHLIPCILATLPTCLQTQPQMICAVHGLRCLVRLTRVMTSSPCQTS